MKSEIIVQFSGYGSKTDHRPHPFNNGTLCGRKGGSEWTTGYYGIYGDVTCKSCIRTIPQARWNTATLPYKYASGANVFRLNGSSSAGEAGASDPGMEAFWMPSKDGDMYGLLIIWDRIAKTWTVLSNEEN